MRHEMVEHKTFYEPSGMRVDELRFQFPSYSMPEGEIVARRLDGPLDDVRNQIDAHLHTIRGIEVTNCERLASREGPWVAAEYFFGSCPCCGVEDELLNENWQVAYDVNAGEYQLLEIDVSESETEERYYACYPDGQSFLDFIPLDDIEDERCADILRPYGHEQPIVALNWLLAHVPLPLNEFEQAHQKETFGAFLQDYMGVYRCQHCGGYWYARYEQADMATNGRGTRSIDVTVTTDDRWIRVHFGWPTRTKEITDIAFDTIGGVFEVDGIQGFKTRNGTRCSLGELTPAFHLPDLFDFVGELLAEKASSVPAAVAIMSANRKDFGINRIDDRYRIIDLAIANRFRGYPDEFYRGIYRQNPDWRGLDGEVRPCETLPLDYCDVDASYRACGLPNVKSVRRLAFRQPLIIAYAFSFIHLPFDDVNILRSFFMAGNGLDMAEQATKETKGSLFYCIKQAYGELAAWKLLMNPPDGLSLGELFRHHCCDWRLLPEDAREIICAMHLKQGVRLLRTFLYIEDPAEELENGNLYKEYFYSAEKLALQGVYEDVSFSLPKTEINFIIAGARLRNCLTVYRRRQRQGGNVVLFIRSGANLVGAVEVCMTQRLIVQAVEACNKRISRGSHYYGALRKWAMANSLVYRAR